MRGKLIFSFLCLFVLKAIEAKVRYFPKHYISTCSTNNCEGTLNACSNCFGENQCKSCISTTTGCSSCANDIFKREDLEDLGGTQYLICDSSDSLQTKVCHLFCRGQYKQTGNCVRYNNLPVCECSSNSG